jgi:DNA-binding IclR family transcriptional regulator
MSGRIPLHATANGKAWLATLPLAEALRILDGAGLAPQGRSDLTP